MALKNLIPLVSTIIKWIDEWKSGATERRLRKIQKLKDQLKDVEKELAKFKNFKNMSDYRSYVKLLNAKRVLERKIMGVANK